MLFFSVMFDFYNLAPNSLGGQSGQFSSHLSHQGNRGFILSMTLRDRTMWCHLSTIPGITPHCWVNTEGNINSLRTRSLVYTESGQSISKTCCNTTQLLDPSPCSAADLHHESTTITTNNE